VVDAVRPKGWEELQEESAPDSSRNLGALLKQPSPRTARSNRKYKSKRHEWHKRANCATTLWKKVMRVFQRGWRQKWLRADRDANSDQPSSVIARRSFIEPSK